MGAMADPHEDPHKIRRTEQSGTVGDEVVGPTLVDESTQGVEATPTTAAPPHPPIMPPALPPRVPATTADEIGELVAPVARETESLESRVGSRWFAIAGALIVIVGMSLFAKLAWDLGWFKLMSGGARCVTGAVFGFALLGLGEAAHRWKGRGASWGLYAAGVGTLYSSAFATHVLGVASFEVSFGLMVVVSAIGMGVALRAGSAAVGVLALVGGFIVPVLLNNPDADPRALPAYLLSLLGAGLALAVWRGGSFRALRTVAFTGVSLLGAAWVLEQGIDEPVTASVFLGATWALVQVSLWVSTRREALSRLAQARILMTVGMGTTWAALLTFLVYQSGEIPLWFGAAALTVGHAVFWQVSAGMLRVLRDVPHTATERFGALHAMLAGALFALTIGLALSGWTQILAWFVIGVGVVVGSHWVRSTSLSVYGIALIVVGTARVLVYDTAMGWLANPSEEIMGLVFSRWSIAVGVAAASWLTSAVLIDARNRLTKALVYRGLGVVGSLLVLVLFLDERAEAASLALAWGGLMVAFAGVHRFRPRLGFEWMSVVAMMGVTGAWIVAHVTGWTDRTEMIGLAPGLLWAIVLAGAMAMSGVLLRRCRTDLITEIRGVIGGFALTLVFGATSLEAARAGELWFTDPAAQNAMVTLWWGVFAAGLLVVGALCRVRVLRWCGLGLIIAATGKAVIIDLATVDAAWRVASFLALGMLMLGVAAAYAKSTKVRRGGTRTMPETPDGTQKGSTQ